MGWHEMGSWGMGMGMGWGWLFLVLLVVGVLVLAVVLIRLLFGVGAVSSATRRRDGAVARWRSWMSGTPGERSTPRSTTSGVGASKARRAERWN